jgi:hypothetical protein
LEEVRAKNAELKAELKKYIEFDPELIEDMGTFTSPRLASLLLLFSQLWTDTCGLGWVHTENDISEARDAANRWTDNILTLRKWCSEKFGIEEESFNSSFGVPDDLDYVD